MEFDLTEGKAFKVPALLCLPLMAAYMSAYQFTYETVEIAVEDKHAVFDDRNTDPLDGYAPLNWLVYTDKEVFEVAVDWRHNELRAAERYAALKVDQRYTVLVSGWRVPAFNWYRNIVRIESAPN